MADLLPGSFAGETSLVFKEELQQQEVTHLVSKAAVWVVRECIRENPDFIGHIKVIGEDYLGNRIYCSLTDPEQVVQPIFFPQKPQIKQMNLTWNCLVYGVTREKLESILLRLSRLMAGWPECQSVQQKSLE